MPGAIEQRYFDRYVGRRSSIHNSKTRKEQGFRTPIQADAETRSESVQIENKYGGSARTGIDRKHARSWLLGKSQEFIEVCQLAGVDNWQAIEKKAREMIALVDDYEKKYREIKEHE